MTVLWLCNSLLPEAGAKLGIAQTKPESWLEGMFERLRNEREMQFIYMYPSTEQRAEIRIDNFVFVSYKQLTPLKYEEHQVGEFEHALEKYSPEIIHAFGSEYAHTYAMIKACENKGCIDKAVISIQGLVSIYAKHYLAYMPEFEARRFTLRDILRRNNIMLQRKNFAERGRFEEDALRMTRNVIGRTDWDRACTTRLNPNVKYHFCNETLRPAFYQNAWNIDECEKHSIFTSQSLYPIKGFHLMLEAMADIIKEYPDAHLYTTGSDPTKLSLMQKLRRSYYSVYLEKLIKRYGLKDHVTFLGYLDEAQMCERYRRSHVFVCPSSIENSPNSVGEAMILGVPTVTSDIGGVKDQIEHNREGFVYQADAPYMAAYYVKRIFASNELAQEISVAAREHALKTYDREKNNQDLLEIYKKIRESNVQK